MTKLRFVFIAAVAAVGFGAAPALADCHCSGDEGLNTRATASSVSSAYRGGGYSASHESGVRILRGKVPANFNAAAAGLQRQAIAEDRAAFTSASLTRAAQQRAAKHRKQRVYAAPLSAYRPAYSSLGRVYAIGPSNRSRSRLASRSRGRSLGGFRAQGQSRGGIKRRGRNATKIRGARRTRSSISFARRIRG